MESDSRVTGVQTLTHNRSAHGVSDSEQAARTPFFARLSIKHTMLFAKQLSFLVRAGVPILESLRMLARQTHNRAMRAVYSQMIGDIANGQSLHGTLGKFPRLFSDFSINIIRIGEMGGALSENLAYLAEELQKKEALRKKIVGALIYPIFVTLATLGVTGVLTTYIFPKITPIFQSLNATLPLSTRILITVSNFMREYAVWVTLGAIAICAIAVVVYRKIEPIRRLIDHVLLRTPIIGPIIRGYNLTNICRTMSLLLKSGIPITEAISITSDTTVNRVYKSQLHQLSNHVMKGDRLVTYIERQTHVFPGIFANTVAVGERTGRLSETFMYLAEMYESDVDDVTKNLSNTIEPILMIVMGVIVGFVAVSVITPIYGITQQLQ